jgi:serine/threonine protein kinase
MEDSASKERFDRVRGIFEKASRLTDIERDKFIESACGEDLELRKLVKALLREAEFTDPAFDEYWSEAVTPALESLKANPSQLEALLEDPGTTSAGLDTLVGKTISHFEILSPIGRGGMGMVFKAHDQDLDRTVALKFLPPGIGQEKAVKERFINEARTASALDHPNIATIHEIGETQDQQMFIAMSYYPGRTLLEISWYWMMGR